MKKVLLVAFALAFLLGVATFTLSQSKPIVWKTGAGVALAGAAEETAVTAREGMEPAVMSDNAGEYFVSTMIPYHKTGIEISGRLCSVSHDRALAELTGSLASLDNSFMKEMERWKRRSTPGRLTNNAKQSFLNLMYEVKDTTWEDMKPALSGPSEEESYVTVLIAHKQGAVDMAKVVLIFESDPEIRKLAGRIIAEQQAGIRAMQAWLPEGSSGRTIR
jgi:uncharacterized protein (DUF305 family)